MLLLKVNTRTTRFSTTPIPDFHNSQINAYVIHVQGRTGICTIKLVMKYTVLLTIFMSRLPPIHLGDCSTVGTLYNSLERQQLEAPK